jgi:hypothetical protein
VGSWGWEVGEGGGVGKDMNKKRKERKGEALPGGTNTEGVGKYKEARRVD